MSSQFNYENQEDTVVDKELQRMWQNEIQPAKKIAEVVPERGPTMYEPKDGSGQLKSMDE